MKKLTSKPKKKELGAFAHCPLDFTVYYSKEEFEGTNYIEIKPSKYVGKCWGPGSISISDDAFALLDWAFRKHIRNYDPYEFIDVRSGAMLKVAEDLQAFVEMIENNKLLAEIRKYCRITEFYKREFEIALREQQKEMITAASEISGWIRDQAKTTDYFAILGV